MSADPVQLGLVACLARPGENATGVTLQDELASKRPELLKEVAPRVSRVAFLWNPDHPDNEPRAAQRAAAALGVHLQSIEVHGPGDLDGALLTATLGSADALYVVSSRQTVVNILRIVNFAAKNNHRAFPSEHTLLCAIVWFLRAEEKTEISRLSTGGYPCVGPRI